MKSEPKSKQNQIDLHQDRVRVKSDYLTQRNIHSE